MKIIVAGGTGFLGKPLVEALRARGDDVRVLTRRASAPGEIGWTPDGGVGPWLASLEGAEAIVNLAGAGIAEKRWTEARKREIAESRLLATRSLVAAAGSLASPPRVFVSASAVGYYGSRGDEPVTEAAPPATDFLGTLGREWEEAAQPVTVHGTRLAIVRTGLALAADGGALAEMRLPFSLGVGGRLGSGRQYMSWIHRDDWVRLVCFLIDDASAQGPFNATAPTPVTNAEFTRALGRALHRPAILPVPAFALKILFGELAGPLLLEGQRAVPAKATALGFQFTYTDLDAALGAVFA
ncbi:MAG: TIGR01777 family oxidoreductase [Vicinamibacterales bacterium]|nr:TIGR01777 family oxidoreductase [Vicinamibacterales bacterium]